MCATSQSSWLNNTEATYVWMVQTPVQTPVQTHLHWEDRESWDNQPLHEWTENVHVWAQTEITDGSSSNAYIDLWMGHKYFIIISQNKQQRGLST